jgi:hypothetical protein
MWALLAICLAGCAATLADPAGEGEGAGSDRGRGCKPIDVLFAVDNSGSSTQKEQQALRDAFPGFASDLLDVGTDYRVGLVDGCSQPPTLHTRGTSGPCNFAGGHTWIESSSPTASEEFRCVANIDSRDALCNGNADEQPATTAATALDPAWAGSGQPNAGFSRADALLVVVAITDEDEWLQPPATAESIHDRLVASKSDVVFVGVGGKSECEGPYGSATNAQTLQQITAQFGDRGRFWDLCQGKLDDGLHQAIDAIAEVCP